MLLEQIKNYEIFRPKCDYSKEILHSIATFDADISPVFPYLNAELGAWESATGRPTRCGTPLPPWRFPRGERQLSGPHVGAPEPGGDPGKVQPLSAESDPGGWEGAVGGKQNGETFGSGQNISVEFR